MEENIIYNYMGALKGFILQVLRPGVSMNCETFQYDKGFAVRVQLNTEGQNRMSIIKKGTLNDIAEDIHLKRFIQADDYSNFTFKGTNVLNGGNEFTFIKDNDKKQWSEEAAKNDLLTILRRGKR